MTGGGKGGIEVKKKRQNDKPIKSRKIWEIGQSEDERAETNVLHVFVNVRAHKSALFVWVRLCVSVHIVSVCSCVQY